jgi:flagellar biosynthesis protein FlhG
LSSSLAIGLASTGPRALAVDLDLGGANLHSVFGCAHTRYTVSDVLRGRATLEEALAATTVPGVRLLSGARAGLDAANPHYGQKQKLLRGLRRIDVGHVVIDLGAGSSFNTLDAFIAADRRILVTTPEPTAIENTYHFLKAAFFRSLREVARDPEVHDALLSVLDTARRDGATPRELVESASRVDPRVGSMLRERVNAFDVDLVVNRAELASATRDPGVELAAASRAQLGANLRLSASIQTDSSVPAAIERGVPVMQLFPACAFSSTVRRIVERLTVDEPIPSAPAAGLGPRSRRAGPEMPADAAAERPSMPAFDGDAPGAHLRACRELLGLTLNQLHERTRIRQHHLERIEREQYEQLPPEFYLQAYARLVADALDLPDGEWIAACLVRRARETRATPGRAATPASPPSAADRPSVPSAADLVAGFDFEPELEDGAPDGDGHPPPRGPTATAAPASEVSSTASTATAAARQVHSVADIAEKLGCEKPAQSSSPGRARPGRQRRRRGW